MLAGAAAALGCRQPVARARGEGTSIPFVVFTSPRSGSSWLVDMLDSHPRIAAHAELFLPGDRTEPDYGSRDLPRFEATLEPRRRISLVPHRLAYLNRLFGSRSGVDAVGFKLMYGHPRVHRGLMPYLAVRRTRVVHLIRENTFDQLVSFELADARGVFRARRGEVVPETTVRLDAEGLRKRLEEMEQKVVDARRTIARYRLPTFEFNYERLAERTQDELARVVSFFGVEPVDTPLESSLISMNAGRGAALVENLDEVESELAGTKFASMLR